MVYIRGNRADYDGWREAGCEGWGYDELLPYFKRAEDNERGASELHGAGGPLSGQRGPRAQPDHRRLPGGLRAGRPAG